MTKEEYNKLKTQVDDKYNKTVELAEKERSEGLKAIETVWNMLKCDNTGILPESPIPLLELNEEQESGGSEYGSLTVDIKKALCNVPEFFTKRDIIKNISYKINGNSLAGCLSRLERQGIIVKTQPGRGRIPSKYKKKDIRTLNF